MESVKLEYKEFLNTPFGVNRYNEFKSILYSNPDSLIEQFNNDYLTNFTIPNKKTINICDIGGGDGKRIIQILEYFNRRFDKRFFLDFVEQSELFSNSFRESSSLIKTFSSITIQNKLFEDTVLNRKYDFIFLIHSIFTFQNPDSINRLLSLVEPNGKIILFSNSQNSFLGTLKNELDKGYGDKRLEINDVKDSLKDHNINFQSSNFYTTWQIKVNDFKSKIDIILDWLSLGHFKKLTKTRKDEIYSLIIESSELINNKYYIKEKEEIIVIPNQSNKNIPPSQPYTLPSRTKNQPHVPKLVKEYGSQH